MKHLSRFYPPECSYSRKRVIGCALGIFILLMLWNLSQTLLTGLWFDFKHPLILFLYLPHLVSLLLAFTLLIFGRDFAARFFAHLSICTVTIVGCLLFGPAPLMENYFIVGVFSIGLTFTREEWRPVLVLTLYWLLGLLYVRYNYQALGAEGILSLPGDFIELFVNYNYAVLALTAAGMMLYSAHLITQSERNLEHEFGKSEKLLLNILPKRIADRLKTEEGTIADRSERVTILFADIVGFTKLAAGVPPRELVGILDHLFTQFDGLLGTYNLEKIKTIGDAYMVASGLLNNDEQSEANMIDAALAMQEIMATESTKHDIQLRIGIHTGPAVAGVIGKHKFAYDLWGDAVNTASRMESHGEAGKIQVSSSVYEAQKHAFAFEERGVIEIKGKGDMQVYWVAGRQNVHQAS